jgi:hypothetical protein
MESGERQWDKENQQLADAHDRRVQELVSDYEQKLVIERDLKRVIAEETSFVKVSVVIYIRKQCRY